jgi:predicted DNA-binding transcriptional regulator AlpA
VQFSISAQSIKIPRVCPALGIPIVLGEKRSDNSPSLDRIVPEKGYVLGNVRVISDKANRLKADLTHAQLLQRAITGTQRFRRDYRLIADYVRRESAFGELRDKFIKLGASEHDWGTISRLLDPFWRSVDLDGTQSENRLAVEHMTSLMIEDEFGLTKSQVRLLRRRAGFPRPTRKRDGFRFVRAEVEQWIAKQPDPSRPAAMLIHRNRPRIAVNSKAAAHLRALFPLRGLSN